MTTHEVDVEEQDFLESYERGEWQPIAKLYEVARMVTVCKK